MPYANRAVHLAGMRDRSGDEACHDERRREKRAWRLTVTSGTYGIHRTAVPADVGACEPGTGIRADMRGELIPLCGGANSGRVNGLSFRRLTLTSGTARAGESVLPIFHDHVRFIRDPIPKQVLAGLAGLVCDSVYKGSIECPLSFSDSEMSSKFM